LSHESYSEKEERNYTQWTDIMQSQPSMPIFHRFTGRTCGIRKNEAPRMNTQQRFDSTEQLHAVFLKIIQLLVEETKFTS
jgi:hypothetical protein